MQIGCNYWASHAGTRMWRDWREDVVDRDFERLAGIGCDLLRVFPVWKEFQPIEAMAAWLGREKVLRMKDWQPLPDTPCGHDGVDEVMIGRFRRLAELAEKHHLELVVGIVTGWMSGTLFVPQALEKRNIITDPLALKWQSRFVRRFVTELKDCRAIKYWELGNECNCMGNTPTSAEAWQWTSTITSAIRLADPTRPVASGMHGLMPGDDAPASSVVWSIEDQGELCDVLTSHPYPHSPSKTAARVDPHNSIRTAFQAAVETLFYADMGGRPGAMEEIGTFSPSYCAEKEKAEFLRASMFNCWAHGSLYYLWWCAFDQSMLDFPPYDLSAWERELGMFRPDFTEKPVAGVFRSVRAFLDKLPVRKLPPFQRDAVCVIPREQSFDYFMGNAWSCFLLAKQSNFDIRFHYCMDGTIPEAPLYLVPGLCTASGLYKMQYQELLKRVREDGASLYISLEDGALSPFDGVFGAEVMSREARTAPAEVRMDGETYSFRSPFKLRLRLNGAEVLAAETDGNPVFTRCRYGKGFVYLMTLPIEADLGAVPGAFERGSSRKMRKFYQKFAAPALAGRRLFQDDPLVTLTEHPVDETHCYAAAVNNSAEAVKPEFRTAPGWKIVTPVTEIAPFSGVLLELRKGQNG